MNDPLLIKLTSFFYSLLRALKLFQKVYTNFIYNIKLI